MLSSGHGSSGKKKGTAAHLVIVGIQYAGHFGVLLQMVYHMAEKYPGLKVTILISHDQVADMEGLKAKGDLRTLDLHLEAVFGEMPVYHEDPRFPTRAGLTSAKCYEDCESWRKKVIAEKDAPGRPTAMVADMFQIWSKEIADELGIPWYTYFSTCPALTLNAFALPQLIQMGAYPLETSTKLSEPVSSIPGLSHLRIRDLVGEIFQFKEFYFKLTDALRGAAGVIHNTSEELDESAGTVNALRKLVPSTRFLSIGPSMQHPGFGFIWSKAQSSSQCLEWLDTQAPDSVLYVAFGSLGTVSEEVIVELAEGLVASGVPFLWALRVGAEVLPEGFQERIRGQGFLETRWVPQSEILMHRSTGGFLSHCGWNSAMESICSKVPIIAWPLSADQPMTARFVSDAAKIGIAMSYAKSENKDSSDDIGRNEIAKMVKRFMLEEEGRQVRQNVAEMGKSLAAAVAEGGSSYRTLHALLEELTATK